MIKIHSQPKIIIIMKLNYQEGFQTSKGIV